VLVVINIKNLAKLGGLQFVRFFLSTLRNLSFLLPLVHQRAAAALQTEIKKTLMF